MIASIFLNGNNSNVCNLIVIRIISVRVGSYFWSSSHRYELNVMRTPILRVNAAPILQFSLYSFCYSYKKDDKYSDLTILTPVFTYTG